MDITAMKSRCNEAKGVAKLLSQRYEASMPVDSIVCLDGMQVVGTYLAEELTKVGILSYNAHKTLYVLSPEYSTAGQIIFRDNMQMAIKNKYILILMGSVTTGRTLETALECIRYYQGRISGACAVFSAVKEVDGVELHAVFHPDDIQGFNSYKPGHCPLCASDVKLDAIVNSFGYSALC
jgi:orotate phosphoribosyltransferase